MSLPTFTMRQLLEAGVHFGHSTRRWNPKMKPYIFGVRNGIHILDLQQTVPMLYQALNAMRAIVAGGGRVLFVGTKRQASEKIAESAQRCGQYYVNHRWLGGMLTNWQTVSKSIKRLRDLEKLLEDPAQVASITKKELLGLTREKNKLDLSLGGIKELGGIPDAMFVLDTNKEALAIAEAKKLGIPVFAVLDSNCVPDGIDYIIPGNDDALRSINFYCDLFSDTVLDGLQAELKTSGTDIGAMDVPPVEVVKAKEEKKPAKKAAAKKPAVKKEAAKKTEEKVEVKTEETPAKAAGA